jgi:hypothetical protein
MKALLQITKAIDCSAEDISVDKDLEAIQNNHLYFI